MILKLIPGQRIHFTVANTEEVKGNFGPQIKFSGATPDDIDAVIFLNVDTAQRQLARIGYSVTTVVGQTVEFARTEKNGTKYTDINRVAAHDPPPKPVATSGKAPYSSGPAIAGLDDVETGAPPATAVNVVAGLDKLFGIYSLIEDHVLAHSAPKWERAKVGSSPESVAAQIATLFIAAKDAGLAR